MTNTIRIPLDPQPPDGVKVEMIGDTKSPNGEVYHGHAMTIGQGYDTILYDCPLGLPESRFWMTRYHGAADEVACVIDNLNVDCVDGVWCWVIDCQFPKPTQLQEQR